MALWTLYRNFKARYTYFTAIIYYNFNTKALLKYVVFFLKIGSEMTNLMI